jgi:hypothetical protein
MLNVYQRHVNCIYGAMGIGWDQFECGSGAKHFYTNCTNGHELEAGKMSRKRTQRTQSTGRQKAQEVQNIFPAKHLTEESQKG